MGLIVARPTDAPCWVRGLDVLDARGKLFFRVCGPFASIWVAGALDDWRIPSAPSF